MIHVSHGPRDLSSSPPPPSRANLKAWWNQFKFMQRVKNTNQRDFTPGYGYGYHKDDSPHPVFGAPLSESLRYASVQISTANSNGELYVWGDIPVVVAKCGLYLKENATEVEGTFRVSGSNKRMRELQALFEDPPKYGKNLDWKKENYTTHDVASVFRRYLTMMPEPVIPYSLYAKFREALSTKQSTDDMIKNYKQLIRSMPRQNQYLLLYVLDLLSVFARKADKNLMTATNLAVIFRPGLINHPQHELSTKEHQLSQEVLEFLILHQDWFMLDVPPPPPPPKSQQQGITPSPILDKAYEGRSSSPHPTVMSSLADPGWRLVEKGSDRTRSRSGRRRSSSASGEPGSAGVNGPANPSSGTGAGSHVRIVSTGRTGDGPTLASGAGAITVSRSRTLPTRRTTSRDTEGGMRTQRDEPERGATIREEGREWSGSREGRGGRDVRKNNVLKKPKRTSLQPQSMQLMQGESGARRTSQDRGPGNGHRDGGGLP